MLIGNTNRLSLIIKDSDTRCEVIDEASVCEAKLDAGSDTRQVVRMYKQIAATSSTAYEQSSDLELCSKRQLSLR